VCEVRGGEKEEGRRERAGEKRRGKKSEKDESCHE
jgi:hypothetical protein